VTRVRLAHGVTGLFLVLVAFFAVALIGLGVAIALAADRIVAAGEGGSATGYTVAGSILAFIGLWLGRATLHGVGAVAVIEVAGDGSWQLRSRFGRVLGRVPADQPRRLELEGQVVWIVVHVPRRQPIVRGRLIVPAAERSFRLAISGPHTYDRALAQLGIPAAAPRPGETAAYTSP
jgi:hypothetical protein